MARTARHGTAGHGMAWRNGTCAIYCYYYDKVATPDQAPWRKHGSDAYRRLGLARSVGQPASQPPGPWPNHGQSIPIKAPPAATRTAVLCALQTTARHPGLIGPGCLPACFTPPAELLADVFFAPCRPIAPQPRRKLHSYPPLAPPTTVRWLPPLHRLRCRPSLLATLLFTRYDTSCPVPRFPPKPAH
jgi:hypothetical protein